MVSAETVGLAFTVIVNVVAVVWGSATLAAEIKQLRLGLDRLTQAVTAIDGRVGSHETRIAVLEDRQDRNNPNF